MSKHNLTAKQLGHAIWTVEDWAPETDADKHESHLEVLYGGAQGIVYACGWKPPEGWENGLSNFGCMKPSEVSCPTCKEILIEIMGAHGMFVGSEV